MTDEQGRASEKKERVESIDVENVEFEFVREVERGNRSDEQNLTTLSEPCTPHKSSLAKKPIKSEGGTPIQGSEGIVPVTWVSGPPTQVQQMSSNSAALALLVGFAEGKIQMQGETIKHLSGVHMEKMKQVTIELIQLDGKLIDKIERVNFLDWSEQKELEGDELLEVEIKKSVDLNLCSMSKQKKGRDPDKLSPVAENRKRAAEAKEKQREKEKKPKLLPKLGLGLKTPVEKKGSSMATRSSLRNKPGPPSKTTTTETPAKQPVRKSPRFKETPMTPTTPMLMMQVGSRGDEPTFPMEKDPIRRPTQNPRINPETGLPWTTEAEKQAKKDLLEKGTKGTKEGDSSESSSEEGTPRKQRRTSRDLVAKKRVGGGAKKKSRKRATVASMSKGKKILKKAVPSKSNSGRKHGGMLLGVSGQTLVGISHGLKFYRTDEQGRMFDRYGKRIYSEREVQMVEESSEEEETELGVEKLPENDSDDEDTPAEGQQRMVKQGQGKKILERTPGAMGGEGDGDNGSDGDGDDEQEEDDDDVNESEIQALQAKHQAAELRR